MQSPPPNIKYQLGETLVGYLYWTHLVILWSHVEVI